MANSDSFINEVSDEVRRDRLFAILRRWAWLAVLAILVLVGGAAWNEYRRAQDVARAQAFGDALLAAFDVADAQDRVDALAAVPADTPEAVAILAFLLAGEEAAADEPAAAATRLRALAGSVDVPARYQDLALLKAQLLDPLPADEAMALLDRLARPGAPYRSLAIEQQAYVRFSQGEIEAGIDLLRQLEDEPFTTPGLQQRAMQLIVSLEAGASLADAALEAAMPDEAGTAESEPAPAQDEGTAAPEEAPGTTDADTGAADQ